MYYMNTYTNVYNGLYVTILLSDQVNKLIYEIKTYFIYKNIYAKVKNFTFIAFCVCHIHWHRESYGILGIGPCLVICKAISLPHVLPNFLFLFITRGMKSKGYIIYARVYNKYKY